MQAENAVIANGLDLKVDIPGMHDPRVDHLVNIFNHFNFDKIWDEKQAVTDYVLGAFPKGSIFAVGYSDHPHQ